MAAVVPRPREANSTSLEREHEHAHAVRVYPCTFIFIPGLPPGGILILTVADSGPDGGDAGGEGGARCSGAARSTASRSGTGGCSSVALPKRLGGETLGGARLSLLAARAGDRPSFAGADGTYCNGGSCCRPVTVLNGCIALESAFVL